MPLEKLPKARRRYSAGEWYGTPFDQLTPSERAERAKRETEIDGLTGTSCPFQVGENCSKKGGICSLLLYEQIGDEPTKALDPLITTCPIRFLEGGTVFQWIGRTLLDAPQPIVLGQIGFLDRLRPAAQAEADEQDSRDFIGRIDNVLVHPTRFPMDWCAVELQAVYFSGKAMREEFKMLGAQPYPAIPFPAAHRRPDWRSSGPKRLLPQLQTKVPTTDRRSAASSGEIRRSATSQDSRLKPGSPARCGIKCI